MKIIFETLKKSTYNPEFYRTVAAKPFKEIFVYYAKISALLALFMTVVFAIFVVPLGIHFIRQGAPNLIKKFYPAELTITIEKGIASTNVPEPYIVSARDETKNALSSMGIKNMLVVDTSQPFEIKTFEGYQTFALLTKNEIVTQDNNGHTSIQKLRVFPNMTIDQQVILGWVEKINSMLVYVVPAGILAALVILFFGYVIYLVPLFLFALIPFLLAWMKKIPLTYGGAYKMSMYAVIPGLVLKTLLNTVGFLFVPAYLSLLIFMLVIFLNLKNEEPTTLFDNIKE